jgi:Maltokinase N-terminal cap domain
MAVIHQTTMVPSKLELLTEWLPKQDWYVSGPTGLSLAKVGGFRLDDPAGEVGIEFMIVRDDASREETAYLVPMTYRGGPMADADAALIGTSQHGVLGRRWIYDGTADPVLVAALTDLIRGRARAQAQSQSNTPEATVHVVPATAEAEHLGISFARLLVPWDAAPPPGMTQVTALWTSTRGVLIRSAVAAARPLAP